jgi:hypothetical protein
MSLATTLPGLANVTPSSEVIEVSVVMPCLNEALTVGICVQKARLCLERLGVIGEVIVADNGSTDGSQAIAERAGAIVVPVYRKGYGAALQGGISAARGQYVIMGDADDSYDFSKLDGFLERLRAGDDVVMGNRFRGGIMPGAMPWHHRYVGNPVLTGVLNLFYRSGIRDAHCGLRGFRKDAFDRMELTTTGMEFASEMVVRASLLKLKMTEIPTVLHPDGRDRPPHLRSFRDGWRHLRFLMLFCPMWMFLVPSGVMLGIGLSLMAWLTPGMQFIGSVGFDIHTMLLGALLAILGYQVLWMGLFAKTLGYRTGALPKDALAQSIVERLGLERGLVVSGFIFAAGFALHLYLVFEWYQTSLGALNVAHTMREAILGLTVMIVGAQSVFGTLFLRMILMLTNSQNHSHIV